MRYADRLETWLPPECPGCGHKMPGTHASYCAVRAATLRAERFATDEKVREAISRLTKALLGHTKPKQKKPASEPK